MPHGGGSLGAEIERTCVENELVILTWSPIHLRAKKLQELYWKPDSPTAGAMAFWEEHGQVHLHAAFQEQACARRKAITSGAASRDFFGIAYGRNGDLYEGFQLGTQRRPVQVDDSLRC